MYSFHRTVGRELKPRDQFFRPRALASRRSGGKVAGNVFLRDASHVIDAERHLAGLCGLVAHGREATGQFADKHAAETSAAGALGAIPTSRSSRANAQRPRVAFLRCL